MQQISPGMVLNCMCEYRYLLFCSLCNIPASLDLIQLLMKNAFSVYFLIHFSKE